MPVIDALRDVLDGEPASFQLMGEDLALLDGARLRAAAKAHDEALARIEPGLRARLEAEQAALLLRAHAWLRRYNRSLLGRVAGYVELGRVCRFEYPWPVVAVLGICQVMAGMTRNRVHGLLAPLLQRLGLPALTRLVDRSDDVLRRTNRGIFADSVPTVLLGLRAHELRVGGDAPLADALLTGPLPAIFDEHSRELAIRLDGALGLADGAERFAALADLTLRHFDREQAIFTHNMGAASSERAAAQRGPGAALMRWLTASDSLLAPAVVGEGLTRRVLFKPYPLPPGFEMRDHRARVQVFGKAFVSSITTDLADYQTAAQYVVTRFGAPGERVHVQYPDRPRHSQTE